MDLYAGARQALRPELGKDDLRTLGARIRRRPVELAVLALQIIDAYPLRVHPARGHVDDPCRGAFLEQWDQQVRQQIRADHVGRERELDPVGRERAFFRQHARVVDQNIETRSLISKASGELADRLELAEVAERQVHVAVTGALGDARARLLAAIETAGEGPDRGAQTRKALSGSETKPRAGARDQHHLALHLPQLIRAPAATADPVADVRVTGDHGAVQHAVKERVDHALSERSRCCLWPERSGYAREVIWQRGLVNSSWTSHMRRSANPASQ